MDVKNSPTGVTGKKQIINGRPRLRAIVRNAGHRARHDGLALQIKKYTSILVDTLDDGEFVLCINNHGTILTLYGPNRVYVQKKSPNRISDERALMFLPQIFLQKKALDYDEALSEFIYEMFPKWRKT